MSAQKAYETYERVFELPKPKKKTAPSQDAYRRYLGEISHFKLLNPGEEYELAIKAKDGVDHAVYRLITSHLRLVVKIAMEFQRRWKKSVVDLIQEGNVGLMKAVQKYDPERKIKFSYYASFWIKAYILKYIMDNWRLVKIGTTQAQRKLFYNLNKEQQRLKMMGFEPSVNKLSKNLKVKQHDVVEMKQRMGQKDQSLDAFVDGEPGKTVMDFLPDEGCGVEDTCAKHEVFGVLSENLKEMYPDLNEKEKDVFSLRLMSDSPMTLREIGEKYSISRERVRQIELKLVEKIRDRMKNTYKDFSRDWIC